MKRTILIAEDDTRMRILISDFLKNQGYSIIEAKHGCQAIEKFKNNNIDLAILDIMMPYLNGFEVCKEIRKISDIPIVMLTAKNTEIDELNGFKNGSDEYITKPFSPTILVARINALIKRTYQINEDDVIKKGALTVILKQHKVILNDEPIDLSQTEYNLLLYFIENESIVLTRNQLLNKIWGIDYQGTDRTVDTHINRLRIKFKDYQSYIQTVRGYGYKFEVTI
ncbi:response regulator transcription factor [Clostridiaceae bacterium M8S5]|nr:response regulator transcription factor [Clostridiaceae bacterium M8S5]